MFQKKLPKNKTHICLICTTIIFFAILIADYFYPRGEKVSARPEGIYVPIIAYQSISRDESLWGENVISPIELEKDIIYLKQNGYTPVFIQELIDYVHIDTPLPEKPVVLTFDNGYSDNFEYVLPLLEKYDFKATISVVGSFTEISDNSSLSPYLSSEEITKLYESCHVEIANQSFELQSLSTRQGALIKSGESYEDYRNVLLKDLSKAQEYLLNNSKIVPTTFTYPYGLTCEAGERVVKSMGFKASLGGDEKPNFITKDPQCLYNLNRYKRTTSIDSVSIVQRAL